MSFAEQTTAGSRCPRCGTVTPPGCSHACNSIPRCGICGQGVGCECPSKDTHSAIAVLIGRLNQERAARERAEAERDSLRLERDGSEHMRLRDNEYLLTRAEAAERRFEELAAMVRVRRATLERYVPSVGATLDKLTQEEGK